LREAKFTLPEKNEVYFATLLLVTSAGMTVPTLSIFQSFLPHILQSTELLEVQFDNPQREIANEKQNSP
jgi:hypothetical protein